MVKTIFIEGTYEGKVSLSDEVLDYLKKYNKIGLFAAVQFVASLKNIKEQLKEKKMTVVTSKAKRCCVEGQLLGCDCRSDSLNLEEDVDVFLYIGDGKFHPQALVYGNAQEVVCYNPKSNQFSVLTEKDVDKNLKRYRGSMARFHSARDVGVLITLKPGQEYYKKSLELEEKYPEKKFYYFIDNNISFNQLENFNFIECWVNTACPRIGLDDQEAFRKGVVNLKDVL
ncbi:MAG: diphthamide synthesis protein [Candidatus Woesearchaeota archaeon]|nr:2-(3-amino-3-carboxypropyl)histidine synthase subunit [Nanoarchaeota archaeon]MBU1623065.1 2-(3-amino-3-carboxypropyl)histidine synthase subunit [Nanoarchaeota archaeon]MBU1974756.1 2-(3-amino-3-carboxypropyl)histidine synthase subunit [Nanoarchaeota archaeon]